MRRASAIRERAYNQVSPFGNQLIDIGNQSLTGKGDAFNAFLAPVQTQLGQGFAGARQNLWEALGNTGQLRSGVGVGPMANLFSDEANALANAYWNAQQTGIGLGLQGSNVLQGQQALFNPAQNASVATMDPRQFGGGFWQNLLGGIGGAALGGLGYGVGSRAAGKIIK